MGYQVGTGPVAADGLPQDIEDTEQIITASEAVTAPAEEPDPQPGVRKVRLYDARHAVLSWIASNGVPDTVVSAWAGHSDLSFTKRVYVHPDPQSLKAGSDKLGELLAS